MSANLFNEDEEPDTQLHSHSESGDNEENYWDDDLGEFASRPSREFSQPLNEFICLELERMKKVYNMEKDVGREKAYRKAIEAVKALKVPIRDERDITHVKFIGPKIT